MLRLLFAIIVVLSTTPKSSIAQESYVDLHLAGQLAVQEGRFERAADLFEKALQLELLTVGKNHSDTIKTKRELAWAISKLGQSQRAADLFEDVMVHREKSLGQNHELTIDATFNLAKELLDLENFQLAYEKLKIVASYDYDIHGPDSPILATTLADLSRAAAGINKLDEAETLSRWALNIKRLTSGLESLDYIAHQTSLVYLLLRRKKVSEAEQLAKENIQSSKAAFGVDSYDLTFAKMALAAVKISKSESTKGQEKQNILEAIYQIYWEVLVTRSNLLGPNHTQSIITYEALLTELLIAEDWSKIYKYTDNIIDEFGLLPQHISPEIGAILLETALNLTRQGKHQWSYELDQLVVKIYKHSLGQHSATATAIENLAVSLGALGKYEASILYALEALEIRYSISTNPKNDQNIADSYKNLAISYAGLGQNEKSLQILDKALVISEEASGSNSLNTINIKSALAMAHMSIGSLSASLEYFLEVEKYFLEHFDENAIEMTPFYSKMGTYFRVTNELGKSKTYLEKAIEITSDYYGKDSWYLIKPLSSYISLVLKLGDSVYALNLSNELIELVKDNYGKNNRTYADALMTNASALIEMGSWELANSQIIAAIEIIKIDQNDYPIFSLIKAMNSLAINLSNLDQTKEAVVIFDSVIELMEKRKEISEYTHITVRLNLLTFLTTLNYKERAWTIIEDLELRNFDQEPILLSRYLAARGMYYLKVSDYEEALTDLNSAWISRASILGNSHPLTIHAVYLLAMTALKAGDEELAEEGLRIAIEEGALAGHSFDRSRVYYFELASLYWGQGRFAEALEHIRKLHQAGWYSRSLGLDVVWGHAEGSGDRNVYESMMIAQYSQRTAAANAFTASNARSEFSIIGAGGQLRELQDLSERLIRLEALTLDMMALPDRQFVEADDGLDVFEQAQVVRDKMDELIQELSELDPRYTDLLLSEPVNIASLQEVLIPTEAVVVVDSANKTEGSDYVWVITKESARWAKVSGKGPDIDDLAKALRTSASSSKNAFGIREQNEAHLLYDKLLGPFLDLLVGKTHLNFVLHGEISVVPPHLLVVAPTNSRQGAEYLIDRFAITVMPSLPSLVSLKSSAKRLDPIDALLGFANPTYDPTGRARTTGSETRSFTEFFLSDGSVAAEMIQGATPLPETEWELMSIVESLQIYADTYVATEASEETLKTLPNLNQFDILYFATHGIASKQIEVLPGRYAEPGLLLAGPLQRTLMDDGYLSASEIVLLDLDADWVILSACNTASAAASNEQELLSGLARAFFYAGARSLLVSHWAVDNQATADLMTKVFKHYGDGVTSSGSHALQRAIRELKSDEAYSHPYYWAPFILVGQPSAPGVH